MRIVTVKEERDLSDDCLSAETDDTLVTVLFLHVLCLKIFCVDFHHF